MLYITRKDGRETTWHVGQERPLALKITEYRRFARNVGGEDREWIPFTDVVGIQADGHELDHIKKRFTNIPMSDRPIVKWNGELAQFIYDNL